MYLQRSQAFDDAVRDGRPAIAYADLYRAGNLVKANMPLSGRVTIDETAASRRSFSGQVIDDGNLAPRISSDPFTPYGSELQLWSGFILPRGVPELLPMARIRLEDVETDGRIIECSGSDRSLVVVEARPEVPYVIANGTNLSTAIQNLLSSALPGLDFSQFSLTTVTLGGPIILEETSDKWQEAQDLASSNGFELFFDQIGRPIFRPKPDATQSSSSWTYTPGPNNIYLGGRRKFSSKGLKNIWVAKGEQDDQGPTVRASAEVSDTTNPLHPAGFGRRPEFYASQYLKTTAQCQSVANALKVQKASLGESLRFKAIPHPAHEAGDVAYVSEDSLGVDDPFVLRSWDFDLLMRESVEFTTRSRRNS